MELEKSKKLAKHCNDLSGKEWLQFSFSIWRDLTKTKEEKDLKHPASFPVALCERLLRSFSKRGSRVIDPFNGIGSSMVAANNLGFEGVGIDLSQEFCEIAKRRVANSEKIKIINEDAFLAVDRLPENDFDICITSPPYWDILNMKRTADGKTPVNYSENKNDLGNIENYSEFVSALQLLFRKMKRVLKPNSYCIVNVMDIRKKNVFYPLHIDLVMSMREIGYILDDIIIWDRQNEYNYMRPLGYPYRFRINKVHEYFLVFINSK